MRLIFLYLLIFFSWFSYGQVKEVQFMGKTWYWHGIDIKMGIVHRNPEFYTSIVLQADKPNSIYAEYLATPEYIWGRVGNNPISTTHMGFAFRPFYHNQYQILRSLEFCHNLDFERYRFEHYGAELIHLRGSFISYRPQLSLSTPSFLGYLKFYATGSTFGSMTLRSFIYSNPPADALINNSRAYPINNHDFKARLASDFWLSGFEYGLGLKMNVSCLWNFHLECINQTSWIHSNGQTSKPSENISVRFGLRYKFAIPDQENESDTSSTKPSVFW